MIFRQVPTDPDHDEQAEDDLFYRDTLQELVQVGATLARLLQTQAIADAQATVQGKAPSTPLADHAATFDRIARAVRRTVTLARSLREPPSPARAPAHPSAAVRTPALHEAGKDAAGHPSATPAGTPGRDDDAEAPSAGLRDRPEAPERDRPDRDAPDCDEDVTGRPPAAVIAEIRRDLGLDTPPSAKPFTHGTPADAELLCTHAAPSGAAASSTSHPGAGSRTSGPQDLRPNDARSSRDPGPGHSEPGGPSQPAAALRAQPAPVHSGDTPPDDQAKATAFVLGHATPADARWRPPPVG